jgi:hypothetical protein
MRSSSEVLTGDRSLVRVVLLALMPWVNVAAIVAVLALFLVPRAAEGHTLATIAAVILVALGLPSLIAAVVFSLNALRGRYPEPEER